MLLSLIVLRGAVRGGACEHTLHAMKAAQSVKQEQACLAQQPLEGVQGDIFEMRQACGLDAEMECFRKSACDALEM